MAKYPAWAVGTDVSAENLALMVPNIVVKAADETTNTDTTFSNDAELSGIALAVGTHQIKLLLMCYANTSATPDIKTNWTFTGTWNDPLRAIQGPGSTNSAAPDQTTPVRMIARAASVSVNYGMASGTVPYVITEESYRAIVTVAGNLSLQWAQNTSDASTITVVAGSTFETRQIA